MLRGQKHEMMEAEIKVTPLQSQGHQRLPGTPRRQEKGVVEHFPWGLQRGPGSAGALTLGFFLAFRTGKTLLL